MEIFPSKQYSFIHNKHGFTVSVIEGSQLLKQLNQIHNIGPVASNFYRKSVLSSLQMINYIKPGENLGFYIDSETPFFRFKIELSNTGTLRTLLLPEEFEEFPERLTGKTRIIKIIAGKEPYTSILDFNEHPIEHLVNEVMNLSYQTKSKVLIDDTNPTSLMITKLPPTNVDKKIDDFKELSLGEIESKFQNLIKIVLALPKPTTKDITEIFEAQGLTYLGSKEVRFFCPCSKQRMIENIFTLSLKERENLYVEDSSIDVRCDYCNTNYQISKDEVLTELH